MRPLLPVVAATAALVLAGCSEPEPGSPLPTGGAVATSAAPTEATSTAPSVSASPTSDATETPTAEPSAVPTEAPTLPPEATTNDAAGAEAFVRHWFDAVNFAYDNLDAEPMLAVSSDECDVCRQISSEVDEYRAQGLRVEGGTFALNEAVAPTPDGTGVTIVAVAYSQDPYRVISDNGEARDVSGESASLGAVLRWEGEEWRMFGLGT
ncbi:DUF6318 family protein [Pseudokineococcus basanitobsidens]|uniref:DUF6318 family protein n=1 Tax=Pseudokineococcus basanitobsidens TaxID=1926649 RepID=A0ABU8RNA9_9ACTN